MGTEKFCLRWNDFESNISSAFRDLREDKDFFDITLACDNDEQIQAHKVILAACSPFFRHVLRRNPHQHPLLYLKGVKFTDLQSVLSFMYHGEVNVAQEELNSFLAVAEELKIKGLTQNGSKETNPKRDKPALAKPRPPSPKYSNPIQPTSINMPDDEIQEIPPIKSEPREQPLTPIIQAPKVVNAPKEMFATESTQQVAQIEEPAWDSHDNYEEYGQYDTGMDQGYEAGMDHSVGSNQGSKAMLQQYIEKVKEGDSKGKYQCTICGKMNGQKIHTMNHVESIHFPGTFEYKCKYCAMIFTGRNLMYMHINKIHKGEAY